MAEMSWAGNAIRWLELAEGATNEGVLFSRQGIKPKPIEKKPTKDFLILGHPRCGTRYMALLFNSLGFLVGHEYFREYGIASWLYAVDSDNCPRFIPNEFKKSHFNYRHVIHVLRNPIDAIA